jgi:adenylosuccinate lyase
MIERYTRPEMSAVFSELQKKIGWYMVEKAVLWARGRLGEIPKKAYSLATKIRITPEIMARADEIEKTKDHDLIAFITAILEVVDDLVKRYLHDGLTSFDVEDTEMGMRLSRALTMLINQLQALRSILLAKAQEHRWTIEIGRSHNVYGEVITFGWKILGWVDAIEFHIDELKRIRKQVAVGKISGAMGTYVLDPRIEILTCKKLGLRPAKHSTQIIGRHYIVRYMQSLAATASTLDRFSTEIRLLAGTDAGEVSEYKNPGASGSSAMPGKTLFRNPIKSENTCGLSEIMRGYAMSAYGAERMWSERSLNDSSLMRVTVPDATVLLDFMIHRFTGTIEKLEVDKEQMLRNIHKTGGVVFAQRVMLKLVEKGVPRPEAYKLLEGIALQVQRGTFRSPSNGQTFKDITSVDPIIMTRLTKQEFTDCFNPEMSLKHINSIFARFGL